jgi:hypothetical protein
MEGEDFYICFMEPFACQYKGESYNSRAVFIVDGRCKLYHVTSSNGLEFNIEPSEISTPNGKIIWVQANKPFEKIQPHELVQAVGERLEEAGIYIAGKTAQDN